MAELVLIISETTIATGILLVSTTITKYLSRKKDGQGATERRMLRKWNTAMKKKKNTRSLATTATSSGGWKWYHWIAILCCIGGLIYLRINDATYDVRYDDFLLNYKLLNLPVNTPFAKVRKAYHKLSLTSHPDRLGPGKCDASCQERWVKISNAYTELKDYDNGKLKLVGAPTRFEY